MKAFFVIFFFADVVGVLAQTLTGKVVNTWDEEPMYGGCVVLAKDSVIGFVENDGTFHVQVPVDAKEISFRFIGFHSLIV
ncbi:MAG TPA: hypothetical protein VFT90_16985, partial [Chryseosolibacter sp.]|nr:hypothetical protein [Chryseosolibacter sp.]